MKSLVMPAGVGGEGQGCVMPSLQHFLVPVHSLPAALHPCSGLGLCRHCCSRIMKSSQRNPAPGLTISMRWRKFVLGKHCLILHHKLFREAIGCT